MGKATVGTLRAASAGHYVSIRARSHQQTTAAEKLAAFRSQIGAATAHRHRTAVTRWPHGEGLADPTTFTADIPQFPEFSDEDTRKVVGDNARELVGVHVSPGASDIELIELVATTCLPRRQLVIVEGILDADRYGPMLETLTSRARRALFNAWDLTFEQTGTPNGHRPPNSVKQKCGPGTTDGNHCPSSPKPASTAPGPRTPPSTGSSTTSTNQNTRTSVRRAEL